MVEPAPALQARLMSYQEPHAFLLDGCTLHPTCSKAVHGAMRVAEVLRIPSPPYLSSEPNAFPQSCTTWQEYAPGLEARTHAHMPTLTCPHTHTNKRMHVHAHTQMYHQHRRSLDGYLILPAPFLTGPRRRSAPTCPAHISRAH